MNKISVDQIPENERIEQLLGIFKPHPTSRFHRVVNTAPWMKHDMGRIQRNNIPFHQAKSLRIIAILSIIAIVSTMFIPSVRAIARQIFYSFINATENQMEVQVNVENPAELFHYSDPSNFSQTIDQVEKLAGFDIKELSSLPVGLELVGARYEPEYVSVIILYQTNDYKLFLTQRKISNGKDVFSIGSDAQIDSITIGDHQAEYVAGGWKAISTQAVSPSQQPDTQVILSAIWDNNLDQYTLRWQEGGYSYELRSLGEGSPSRSELITLADGLK